MRGFHTLMATLCLCACASGTPAPKALSGVFADIALPPMRLFGAAAPTPASRSNAEITQDFLDLSFRLESGAELDGFSRFTGPLTVRMTGDVPATAARDLAALLARIRAEAGLPLAQTADVSAAITIEFLPRRQLQARAPDAACFVAPRVGSWAEYRRAGRTTLDWTDFQRRDRAAIFIPSDVAPQEVRDCLHEELAQALGPLNDLYRLPDSVFNDDNIQTVLTGFDMLILRATYAPDLQPGITKAAVAATLPGVLARINPAGGFAGQVAAPTPRAYGDAIARALGPRASPAGRRAAAEQALSMAAAWQDHRTGFAWLTLGRLSGRDQEDTARQAFQNAAQLYRRHGLALHAAHASMQLAGFALADGQWNAVIALTDEALAPATAAQNASLMAGLMMLKSEALARSGQTAQAARLRLDSLGWARYGMGSDADVKRRLSAIAALAAQPEKTAP